MKLCTLRQGTILVAIIDMHLSGIFLFLLILGTTHARAMSCMLGADMVDPGRREDSVRGRLNNESRMETAQHLSTVTIVTMYTLICIVSVHLISCISLLSGAVLRIRQFLLPWATVIMVELLLGATFLLSAAWVGEGSRGAYFFGALALQIYICLWAIVWQYYKVLCTESCADDVDQEAANAETAATKETVTTIKSQYISFPQSRDKPQHV